MSRPNQNKEILKRISYMLRNFAISFTAVMIVFPIFSMLGYFSSLNNVLVLQILAICFGVSLVQFLTGLIPVGSELLHNIIQFLDMYFVMMLLGAGVFKIFPISVPGFVIPGVFGIIVFVMVWTVAYLSAYRKVQEINRIIQARK